MCHTNYIKRSIVSLTILTLTTLVSVNSLAETATSGNLLPNAGDGHNILSQHSNNTNLDSMGSANGFTLNGITDYTGGSYNELEAQGTGTVSASGSLLNLNLITDQAQAHTTTNTSLDGGVTLNSITEIQNCEWQQSSYRCGQSSAGGGQRDTFSTTIKILDENNNVLAITTMNRNNDAGYRNDSYTYTDTATYTDTGSRNWSWEWQGVDGGDPSNTGAIGPNLLGASLTATLLNVNYTPITEETEEQLEETNELLELAQEDLDTLLENLEEINLEQLTELEFETPILQELEIEEITFEELAVTFEETFIEILKEENLIEEFETALIEESITEEQFFEEATNIIEEEFEELMPTGTVMKVEGGKIEMEVKEEEIANEEEVATEEVVKEEVKEEEVKETKTETETNANTETTTKTEDTSEESIENEQEGEPTNEESTVDENTETEGSETETNNEEAVDDKTTGDDKQEIDSVNVKVKRIIAKLEKTLKDVNDQVKAVQYVTLKGIQAEGADITSYQGVQLNDTIKLNDGNPDFFNQLNIGQDQIYTNVNLNTYSNNDPILIKEKQLKVIDLEKQRLIYEIQELKKG